MLANVSSTIKSASTHLWYDYGGCPASVRKMSDVVPLDPDPFVPVFTPGLSVLPHR